ncbi:hypothetical protein Vadar_004538 [Vaccinium darrowii]|uniref:Uncharacterized protein n=1 Tax=Vaccinium darrowii TaxID=229202 RepID=A0ACB7WY52_9ERIC|nr:hypothetical protein Vadar_004538 [Vaccinium darrowii]
MATKAYREAGRCFSQGNLGNQFSTGEGSSLTVYVDNLPNGVGVPWFYKFFSNFGLIKDVYLPLRRSKRTGFRFGFVRYESFKEAQQARAKASGIRIGKKFLIVERAKCDKESPNTGSSEGRVVQKPSSRQENHYQGQNSNAFFQKNIEKRFTLNVQPIASEWLTRSAVAKLKAFTTPEVVQKAFSNLKFHEVRVKSLGGMNLIVTFQSKEDRISAIQNPLMANWFSYFKPWNGEVAGLSRLIRLKSQGMPLSAWNALTFKNIGSLWGEVISLDDDTVKEKSYEVGSLVIVTECDHKIDDWINITVRGRNQKVRVWEEDCNDMVNENPISDWVQKQHLQCLIPHAVIYDQDIEGNKVNSGPTSNDEVEINNSGNLGVTKNNVEPHNQVPVIEIEKVHQSTTTARDIPNSLHSPSKAFNQLGVTREESEESRVEETPDLGYQNQVVTGINEVQEEEGVGGNNEHVNEDEISETLTAKEKRFRKRREIRELLETQDHELISEGQGNLLRIEESVHSDSINSVDIERRNVSIRNAYEKALIDSKRLGVIHLESDDMVIQRMMQFGMENANINPPISA